jgi:hypothetical protein
MPENSTYIQQWDRVNRWHQRLRPIAEGIDQPPSIEHYRDDTFAFFLNCYHLKDWIKNDQSVPHLKDRVEPYINESWALSLCADLCNGLKHLSLTNTRSGQHPAFGSKVWRIPPGSTAPHAGIGFWITGTSEPCEAFYLAGECMMAWETFFLMNSEPA